MKPLAIALILLGGLPAFAQDRAQAVANLEKCIRDVSVEGHNCDAHPLEKVVDLYSAGDHSLLPLILRAHEIRYSGTDTDPGRIYLEIFGRHPEDFLAAVTQLPAKDRVEVFDAFSSAVAESSQPTLDATRGALTSSGEVTSQAETSKRLLYEVELKNAFRLHQYFPPGTFSGRFQGADEFVQPWYAENLLALHESAIYYEPTPPGNALYRFLWIRTFHNPVSVRLRVFPDGSGLVTLRVSDGAGGYNPGVLATDKETRIEAKEVGVFLKLLERANFWKEPVEPPPSNTVGLDGAQWVFEANKEGEYHVVDRWSPESGPLREAGLLLLKKSGYIVPKDEIY